MAGGLSLGPPAATDYSLRRKCRIAAQNINDQASEQECEEESLLLLATTAIEDEQEEQEEGEQQEEEDISKDGRLSKKELIENANQLRSCPGF